MDPQASDVESSLAAPHALSDPNADPKARLEEVHAFLKALNEHPGGPHICDTTISFRNAKHKKAWVLRFSYMGKYSTFSRVFNDGGAGGARNRLVYFCRATATWVGNKDFDWECKDWRSSAIALVQKPGVAGRVLVIYDVDCVTKTEIEEQEKSWSIRTISHHRTFYQWIKQETRQKIGEIWYNQDLQYKGQGQGLQRSLEWLKEMTLLGDNALSEMDWEAAGFSELGTN